MPAGFPHVQLPQGSSRCSSPSLFLILTLGGAYFFPDGSLGSIALAAFASVVVLRLALLALPKRQRDDHRGDSAPFHKIANFRKPMEHTAPRLQYFPVSWFYAGDGPVELSIAWNRAEHFFNPGFCWASPCCSA